MLQLLAAIPTIFSAISKVSELFKKGKEAVKTVSGKVSEASSTEELRTEIDKLPNDEKNRWAEIMSKEVDMYAKQNERLAIEIGLIDPNITGKLDTNSANKIAMLRMTTRPWTVRLMVHYILFPFYLIIVDLIQNLAITFLPFLKTKLGINPFNSFDYVFGGFNIPKGIDKNALEQLFRYLTDKGHVPSTFAGELYTDSIPWVVGIIVSYMGLREFGKATKGYNDMPNNTSNTVSVVSKGLSEGLSLFEKIQRWFKKL